MLPLVSRVVVALFIVSASKFSFAQIVFEDVTDSALPGFSSETWGASWGDYNGDHWPDLFVGNHRQRPSLYRNNGDGTFSNVILQVDKSRAWLSNRYIDHHGAAFTDIDGDGNDDLLSATNGCCPAQLMISDGTRLTNEAYERGVDQDGAGWSVTWFDYNGDGPIDLARLSFRNSELFDQSVGGRFNAGPIIECEQNNYGQLSDLNDDGVLDFVCAREGTFPQKIYSTANGVPEDITNAIPAVSNTVDTIIADFDGDLRTDVFALRGMMLPNQAKAVSNHRIEASLDASPTQGEIGFSFQADGVVDLQVFSRFSAVPVYPGATGNQIIATPKDKITLHPGDASMHGMRTSRTGHRVFVGYEPSSKTWQVWQTANAAYYGRWWYIYIVVESDNVLRNVQLLNPRDVDLPIKPRMLSAKSGEWRNITWDAGFRSELLCSAVTAGDYDNDMDLDIYLVCRNGVENIANRLFENDGKGHFSEVPVTGAAGSIGSGLQSGAGIGETAVTADYDNDGSLDLMVTNGLNTQPVRVGGPHQLFRNETSGKNWITLSLRGTTSNPSAVGARVLATAGGVTQLREQNGGYHRWSQDHQRIHFGLSDNTEVDLVIEWPGGRTENLSGVDANAHYQVTEASGIKIITPGSVADFDPPASGDECSAPAYLSDLDRALFIWKDCNSGVWHFRVTAGGAEDFYTYTGSVNAEIGGKFSGIQKKSFESNDVLGFSSSRIDFHMTTSRQGQDGFSVSLGSGQPGCLSLSSPANPRVYLGAKHIPITLPFSLAKLGTCRGDPTLSMDTQPVNEGVGAAKIIVKLEPASDSIVRVRAATRSESAVAGSDFYGAFENIVFQPGETEHEFSIPIVDDSEPESAEELTVRLFQNDGAPIRTPNTNLVIEDNDTGMPTVSVVSVSVSEADVEAVVIVRLSEPAAELIAARLATKADSARGGSDFYGFSDTITFQPGEVEQQIPIPIVDDGVAEVEETFLVRLFNVIGNVTIAESEATVTITDDD